MTHNILDSTLRATWFAVGLLGSAACAPRTVAVQPESYAELLATCRDKDGWRDPAPPVRLDRQVFYVGTCGIGSILVTSPQGHALIDSAEHESVPLILANIRRLGFDPHDIKWLLASHVHFDHAGGHAAMQAATGAQIAALPDQSRELEQGAPMADDPQHGSIAGIQPVRVDRILRDGEPLLIGANQLTPYSTSGHTRGSTSWVIRGCGQATCAPVVYADSASAVSADGYRFTDHPQWVAMFRAGVARIGTLPCALLVTPHPGASALFERFAGAAPLSDSAQCQRYASDWLGKLDERLAKERSGR